MGGFIHAFIGPEGSGKSCLMANVGLQHGVLIAADKYKRQHDNTYERYCLENPPVVFTFPGFILHSQPLMTSPTVLKKLEDEGKIWRDEDSNKPHLRLSQDIDIKDMFRNWSKYRSILMLIDETQDIMNQFTSSSIFNRLWNSGLAQRRRGGLGIGYTIQDWGWAPKQTRQLTHRLTSCFDLFWTPYGKAEGLKRGEVLRLITIDIKGFDTGYPFTVMGRKLLFGKYIWPFYNSYGAVDILRGQVQFLVKKKIEVIDMNQPKGEDPLEQAREKIFVAENARVEAEKEADVLNEMMKHGMSPRDITAAQRMMKSRADINPLTAVPRDNV